MKKQLPSKFLAALVQLVILHGVKTPHIFTTEKVHYFKVQQKLKIKYRNSYGNNPPWTARHCIFAKEKTRKKSVAILKEVVYASIV